ncbi:MAG: adenosylcobinamide amidohydrolase [Candidatus Binatia bacterium]
MAWTATVHEHTFVMTFPELYRVLSWAPLGAGLTEARTVLNHQVNVNEVPSLEPELFLQVLAERLQLPGPVVGMMTGVLMERLVRQTVHTENLTIECFATVGLSNALAVGEVATYEEVPGTINLIVAMNRSLLPATMVEAVQIVTEAKVRALYEARVKSMVSDALATGTGTDCVAIACPTGEPAYRYCGKHTKLGEMIGRMVFDAVNVGIRKTGIGSSSESKWVRTPIDD